MRAITIRQADPDDEPALELGYVPVDRRDEVLRALQPAPRAAAVAVPLYRGADGAYRLLTSRRAALNGWTGAPLPYAGEDVLFGGGVGPGETPLAAALRELREETTAAPDDAFPYAPLPLPPGEPLAWLGRWPVENGYAADGYVVVLGAPVDPARLAYDRREVESIASLRIDELFAARWTLRARRRGGTAADGRHFRGEFESPHALCRDELTGRRVELWGLAGYMLARLADRCEGDPARLAEWVQRGVLFAAGSRRRSAAALRTAQLRAAREAGCFLREVLEVPPPAFLVAPRLSALLGENVVLQLEPTLPLGASGKVRSVGALAWRASDTVLSQDAAASRTAALARAFDGRTLVAASTGSHARAVAALASWLGTRTGAAVATHLYVSADISPEKRRALGAGTELVPAADFSAATEIAVRACERRIAAGERWTFVPTDPVDVPSPDGLFRWSDGMAGFATTAGDALAWLVRQHRAGQLARPYADRLVLATSGGATWAACLAHVHERRAATGARDADIGQVLAVGDAGANPVRASLAAGRPTPVDPFGPDRIAGLAQRDVSPHAFDLVRDLVTDLDAAVVGTTLPFAKLAQLLIFADTGLMPEPAGAAPVGWSLARTAVERADFGARATALLVQAGIDAADLERVGFSAADSQAVGLARGWLVRTGAPEPPGPGAATAMYVVSGAWTRQTTRLVLRRLGENPAELEALLRVLAAMLPLVDEDERAGLRRSPLAAVRALAGEQA